MCSLQPAVSISVLETSLLQRSTMSDKKEQTQQEIPPAYHVTRKQEQDPDSIVFQDSNQITEPPILESRQLVTSDEKKDYGQDANGDAVQEFKE